MSSSLDTNQYISDDAHPSCGCGLTNFDKYRKRMSHEEVERQFDKAIGGHWEALTLKYDLFVSQFLVDHPRIYRISQFLKGNKIK